MNCHQSIPFHQDLSNSFTVGSTFLFVIPEYLNDSWWCSRRHSRIFEDRRRFFSQSCSILFKIRDSSLLPSSRNCFVRENSFHLSRAIQESSQFVIRSPSIQVYSFSAVSYHSPILPVHRSRTL